jgi:hypothetical protein
MTDAQGQHAVTSRAFGKVISRGVLVVLAVLAVATARELTIGRDELAAADAAAEKSDWLETIGHARAAAEALVPGSPWPERGFRRLEAVGHDAEVRGDDETALLAYGAIRTAALATRAIGWSGDRWRMAAEGGLARVAAARKDSSAPRVTAEAMLEALRKSETPATSTLAALAASAFAMVTGFARLALFGAEGRGGYAARVLAAAGFVGYALVLWMN